MLEVSRRAKNFSEQEKQEVINQKILKKWQIEGEASPVALNKTVEYYLAIKEIAEERKYTALSLKDVDGMKKLEGFPPAPIFMLLANEEKLCTIPENDALGNVTQAMVKFVTGQIGAYSIMCLLRSLKRVLQAWRGRVLFQSVLCLSYLCFVL